MANEFVIKNGYFSQGNSNVTGSVAITQNVTASKALFSSSNGSQLTAIGSGSTVAQVHGSQGNLLVVNDNFSGSIFTVTDISGYPILDITSDYYTGSIFLPMLQSQSQQHVVVYDSASGLLTYISASAIGGGGSGIPGGLDQQIQFNSSSVFSGSADFTFNYTTSAVKLTGSLVVSGSSGFTTIGPAIFTGSVSVTQGGFTGSLLGTASYVSGSVFTSTNPALSASYALTASYVSGSTFTSTNPALSASYALTASYAANAAFNSTSSFIGNGTLTSYTITLPGNWNPNTHVTVMTASNYETVYPNIRRVSATAINITFAAPAGTNHYYVYISQ